MDISSGNLSELLDGNKSSEVNSLKSREEDGRMQNGTSVSHVQQSVSLDSYLEKNGDAQVSHEHKEERHDNLGKASNILCCLGFVTETSSTNVYLLL